MVDVIGWLNANANAVQAFAGLAALGVAAVAVVIAALAWQAERSQASSARDALAEAKRQADAADRSERGRRRDERVQAVRPVLIDRMRRPHEEQESGPDFGKMVLVVPVRAPNVPVLDLRLILRRGPIDSHDAAIGGPVTLAPDEARCSTSSSRPNTPRL